MVMNPTTIDRVTNHKCLGIDGEGQAAGDSR